MRLKLKTQPVVEPVSLDEAKNFLKVETTDDDSLISALIKSARELLERYTRRAFITQTWEMILSEIGSSILIPRPPLQDILKVALVDEDLNETVEDSSKYYIEKGHAHPGTIKLKSGQSWSSISNLAYYLIEFKAGYGDGSSDIPETLRQAILQLIAHLYENRGVEEIPLNVRTLINPYRVYWL